MRRLAPPLLCLLSSSCVTYVPPVPPQPRVGTPVHAPFDRTWNAVIDQFAQQVITIETMERASGFIVASTAAITVRSRADSTFAESTADCGVSRQALGGPSFPVLPTSAKYNVLVRSADSSTTTVQVTARFLSVGKARTVECASRGAFERAFEAQVKARAEALGK